MYMDENCSFDPTNITEPPPESAAGAFHLDHYHHHQYAAVALETELQQQLGLGYDNNNNNYNNNNNLQYQQLQVEPAVQQSLFNYPGWSPSGGGASSSSLTFAGNSPSPSASIGLYADPLLHLSLPAPLFPHHHHHSFIAGGDGGLCAPDPGLHFEGPAMVLEFGRERLGGARGPAATTKHFASERHRRDQMRDTYSLLRSLVPNPTKNDRASVVGDAIEYIKELRRSVSELKMLVERKRRGREGNKRHKPENDDNDVIVNDNDNNNDINDDDNVKPETDGHYHNQPHIRSSWLQRKSKDTEVDVRIVDDDVTVKLVQRKKINLLLAASRVLDELRLDLCHVAGGHVGDTYSYLFNTKICEGSSLYASAIANKLMDVLDRQYTTMNYTI